MSWQKRIEQRNRQRNRIRNAKIAFAVVGALAVGGYGYATSFNDHTKIVTITEKERVVRGSSSHYRVWGEDEHGTVHAFRNSDNILRWKWDSSDVQGNLREGETYELNLVGYRVRILSMYQNILNFTPAEKEQTPRVRE